MTQALIRAKGVGDRARRGDVDQHRLWRRIDFEKALSAGDQRDTELRRAIV